MKLIALGRRYLFDGLIVLVAVGGVVEAIFGPDSAEQPKGSLWATLVAGLVMSLPLLARRQLPFGAPALVFLGATTLSFVDGRAVTYSVSSFLGVAGSAFLFGMLAERLHARAGLLIALAAAAIVTYNDEPPLFTDFLFIALFFCVLWAAASVLGSRLEQAAEAEERARRAVEEREERAVAAVAEERQRIARELHDVVAHSVSVMTVQAGGVRRLLRADQEREREALLLVEETGRQALAEMRRLLGILRQPTELPALSPQPGMTSLGGLIEQVREAGLPVEFRIQGEPVPLPPGIDLSAYRIVQEALTNALKHAGPARATVWVRYRPESLELEIENDGRDDGDGESGGQGLVGMQERVSLYGGMLESGPRLGGGYAVRARLPVREEQ